MTFKYPDIIVGNCIVCDKDFAYNPSIIKIKKYCSSTCKSKYGNQKRKQKSLDEKRKAE